MTEDFKNLWDVVLGIATVLGAAIAFGFSLHQWRRGQAWQQAQKMDDFVREFESSDLLCLVKLIIDWTRRQDVPFRDRKLVITNSDSLLALRVHTEMGQTPKFDGEQALFRDAYDALLSFFSRLELAITTDLIKREPAKRYFAYWLQHFLIFDKHPDEKQLLQSQSPEQMVVRYIKAYGDSSSIARLCQLFNLPVPKGLI